MTRLQTAILADDLTGACDFAGPFAASGWRAWVTWNSEFFAEPDADLISVCTDSRNDDSKLAVQKVRRAAQSLRRHGANRVFKKIDSTLRGNWASEMLAVLEELRLRVAVIAPAFPAMGRQIVGGQLHLNGEQQADQISVLAQLRNQTPIPACYVSLLELRKGPSNLAKLISHSSSNGSLFVVDGGVDADLDIVAEVVERMSEPVLAVGSAGLAGSFTRRAIPASQPVVMTQSESRAGHLAEPPHRSSHATALFVGSSNARTQAQIKIFMESTTACEFQIDDAPDQIEECLKRGVHAVVHVQWGPTLTPDVRHLLELCRREKPIGFVLSGGDTAQLICNCCSAHGIWVEGEIGPGLPWGRLHGGPFDGVRVATKAGGFGGPDSLTRIVEFLGESRNAKPGFQIPID